MSEWKNLRSPEPKRDPDVQYLVRTNDGRYHIMRAEPYDSGWWRFVGSPTRHKWKDLPKGDYLNASDLERVKGEANE